MNESILLSGRDTLLVAIPLVLCLVVSIFRLDRGIALPKGSLNRRRLACGLDAFGEPILRDPDGRLSGPCLGSRAAKRLLIARDAGSIAVRRRPETK